MIRSSSVTTLAILGRLNVPAFFQRLTNFSLCKLLFFRPVFFYVLGLSVFGDKLDRLHVIRFPIEIKDFLLRTKKIFRVPVAFQTPRHAMWLGVVNHRHVIDLAMTAVAADPAVYVGGMIVVDIIRGAMQLHPFNRFAGLPTCSHWLQLGIIFLHLRMA